jgi:putative CocE/NonD family hydrolase
MRTRDGVLLYSDVYRPDAEGRFPVLVLRVPYDKGQELYADGRTPTLHLAHTRYFPQHGYVVVAQDTRGRWKSEGEFYPYRYDAADGYDTVEWAAGLPWSNGQVAMVGKSYMGLVQYLTAPERPPHLRAAAPMSAPISYFENCVWRRGVFELGWQLSYVIGLARDQAMREGGAAGEEALARLDSYLLDPAVRFSKLRAEEFGHLPLLDWVDRLSEDAPYLRDLMEHWVDGPFWHKLDVRGRAGEIETPMFHVGSWYDPFLVDTTEMFTRVRAHAKSDEVARAQKMMIGPWTHQYGTRRAGAMDFGPEAELDVSEMELRWYDHWLKGIDTGLLDEPSVRVFVMGKNAWRSAEEWPVPGTQFTAMYLSSGGRANSGAGDGRLTFSPPGEEPSDTYVYDPDEPVPTRGGTTLLSLGDEAGVCDQRDIEERRDVLVYTGEALTAPLEVTGPVSLKLFAASSAPDTDFMAKLIDVHPDGSAYNVADGVIRARFRSSLERPTLINPGEITQYTVDLWSTSHMFMPGHRVRLDLTSSDFPRYDRNPNTGHDFGRDTSLRTARQTIFHDGRYPSHLLLPVIPS